METNLAVHFIGLQQAEIASEFKVLKGAPHDSGEFSRTVTRLLQRWYPYLKQLIVDQQLHHAVRNRSIHEYLTAELLGLAGFPFAIRQSECGSIFLVPSEDQYLWNRTRCIVIGVRHSLSQCWHSLVDELHKTNCPMMYILVLTDEVPLTIAQEICSKHVWLVVYDDVKVARFAGVSCVISASAFAQRAVPIWEGSWQSDSEERSRIKCQS